MGEKQGNTAGQANDSTSRADLAKRHRRDFVRAFSNMSQIAVLMLACVLIGVFLGKFLDEKLGTTPWLLLICSLLGVAAAIKSIYDMAGR